MKKLILLVTAVLSLSACDNNGKVEVKVDSLANDLDTTLEKLADSARQKGGRLLDTLENKFKNLKDSAKNIRTIKRKNLIIKKNSMKRMFLAIVVAGVFTSCSNSGDTEQRIKDSIDSVKNLKVESVQDAANQAIDTIQQRHDSLKKMVDSVGGAVRDSLESSNQ